MFGVNKIISWEIVDDNMWVYCISYASWACERKKNWRNGCVKWKQEWKDPENGKNEKKIKNEKWKDPRKSELKRRWNP